MKTKQSNRFLFASTIVCCFAAMPLATAAIYYWDTNPSTAIAGNDITEGGAGTWDITTANFTISSTDAAATNHNVWSSVLNAAGKDTVVLGGTTGGAITINTFAANVAGTTNNLLLNKLNFTTSGYVLGGTNTIRFVNNTGPIGGSITVAPGVTATINNSMQGGAAGGLTVGTNDGQIDALVDINGGGTLNMGGGNGNMGFAIASGTTVVQTGGTLSGYNTNTLDGTLKVNVAGVIAGPSSLSGAGSLDLNNTNQTLSTLGGALGVTNTNATAASITLGLTLTNGALTHTGVISNGTAFGSKLSLATTGVFAQGSGFNTTTTFSTQTLAGLNTYTGSTSLGRGTIALDFSNAAAPGSNILYNGGFGAPTGDDGKLVINRTSTTINGTTNSAIGSLATLQLTGKASTANSQQFNGLKVNDGAANVIINPGATGGTVTLNLGSTLERSTGGLINFASTNATTALSASATILSSAGTASTVLKDASGVSFAVLGGRDWAAKDAANTNVVAASYTNATPTGFTANADITTVTAGGAGNDTLLSANTTISTLRYGNTARIGISLGGNTLTTGGILNSVVNAVSGSYITNGTITSPGDDVVLFSSGTTNFGLDANIADGKNFTKGGSGIVLQTPDTAFTNGILTLHEGGLILQGSNTPTAVNLNGSQTNLLGAYLPGAGSTAGAYVQLGNCNASGSLGTADINLGVNALLAIKRSDAITLNSTKGAGGITQGWSGTTSLVSAATAKYNHVGDTTVTAGTLKLDYSASNSGILSDSTRLLLGGGTLEYATAAGTTHNDAVRETTALAGATTITKTGTGTGRLRMNEMSGIIFVQGATVNLTASNIADSDNSNTNGILGSRARLTVGSAGSYDWASAAGGADSLISALPLGSYTAAATSGSNAFQSLLTNAGLTLVGNLTTNTLKVDNTGSAQTVDIGANTLTLTAGGLLVTGADAVAINNGTLKSATGSPSELLIHQYNTGGLTIGAVVANGVNSSILTKSGDGTVTLSGTNLYTGQTYINGGKLSISNNTNLGLFGQGTINVASSATNSPTVTLSSATLPAGFGVGSTLLGQAVSSISGTTVTLAGNANAAGANPTAAFSSGSGITLNNGTLVATGTFSLSDALVGTRDRNIALNGVGGTVEVTGSDTLTTGGTITGPGGLTKTGTGTFDVKNGITIQGHINLNEGTLKLNGGINPTRSFVTVASGATLDVFGGDNTLGGLAGDGTVTNTGTVARTLFAGANNDDSTFTGLITNGSFALSFNKMGSGAMTLSGANDYTGGTEVSGGSLTLTGPAGLGDRGPLNVSSTLGSIDLSGITAASETVGTLAGAAGSVVTLGDKNLALGAPLGTVVVTSTAVGDTTVTVPSVPSYLTTSSCMLGRKVTNITGLTVTLDGAVNSVLTAATVTVYPDTGDTVFAGVINGTTSTLTKDGDANTTLSGANAYDGQTTIDRGALIVTHPSGLGSTVGGTRINYNGNSSGGRLDISGGVGSITIDENITLAGGRFGNNYTSGFRATGGTVNLTNPLLVDGQSEIRLGAENANTVLNFQAGVSRTGGPTGGGLLLFKAGPASGVTINFNGAIDNNGGTVEFTDGLSVLNVASTTVGNMQIDYNGKVKLGVDNAFPATSQLRLGHTTGSGSTDANGAAGQLDMAGYDLSVARVEGSSGASAATSTARKITNSSANDSVLTIGGTGNQTFNGIIEDGSGGGKVSIVKTGANIQTLTSATDDDTYTGNTTINGGKLILGGVKDLADSANVLINGSSVLELPSGVTDVVNGLVINGVSMTGGETYGSSTSGATNLGLANPDDFFTGTGKLSVTNTVVTDDYVSWDDDYAADLSNKAGDNDGDGLTNFEEYAFGLNPTSGSSCNPISQPLDKTTGTFKYTRRATPATTGVTYTYESSITLNNDWASFTSTPAATTDGGPTVEEITVTVPAALLTNPKLFIHVKASQP